MRNTFRILFYVKRAAPDRNGNIPVMVRITINGERTQFSAQRRVNPRIWDARAGQAAGRSAAALQLNERLNTIRRRIEQCYDALMLREGSVSVLKVRELYFGEDRRRESLLAFFRQHNDEFRRMVGINRSRTTLYKYESVYKLLKSYVRLRYGRSDVPFRELDKNFPAEFHRYIAREVPHEKNTVWVYMIALKHIFMLAHGRNFLSSDLFAGYKLRHTPVMRDFLSEAELRSLMQLEPRGEKQRIVLDAFLFSCFTGLSYIDIRQLRPSNIRRAPERAWICTTRSKTGSEVYVRLFDVSSAILARYLPENPEEVIFRLPSNGWCNICLRRLLPLAGIMRPMTFHAARHTFATTITLSQGIPIETISKLLGHKNIRTTQIYAAITQPKLDDEMDRLSRQLRMQYIL